MTVLGRPRTWLSEADFIKKCRLLIPKPSECICGFKVFRFGFIEGNPGARCNDCGALYIFINNFIIEKWTLLIK